MGRIAEPIRSTISRGLGFVCFYSEMGVFRLRVVPLRVFTSKNCLILAGGRFLMR